MKLIDAELSQLLEAEREAAVEHDNAVQAYAEYTRPRKYSLTAALVSFVTLVYLIIVWVDPMILMYAILAGEVFIALALFYFYKQDSNKLKQDKQQAYTKYCQAVMNTHNYMQRQMHNLPVE